MDSWVLWFFIGLVVSKVSWFHRFCGVKGLNGLIGFMGSVVSWFHGFCGFIGFVVSKVSQFLRFHGFLGFKGFVVP